jgi:hypothetical protein
MQKLHKAGGPDAVVNASGAHYSALRFVLATRDLYQAKSVTAPRQATTSRPGGTPTGRKLLKNDGLDQRTPVSNAAVEPW